MSKEKNCVDSSDILVPVSVLNETAMGNSRLIELCEFFRQEFRLEPEFFVRVPGRVNIIGEHIDYCGYPVLPMAIEQCILLAVTTNKDDSFLNLKNINSRYGNFKCDLKSFRVELPKSGGPEWYNYFLCGIKGLFEHIGSECPKLGMSIAVSGNIPPASGLSSSSALVSSAALATAFLYNVPLNRSVLASISARSERYIGTQGGGMDQAIAFLAKKGCAQFIEFHPELQAHSVQLPSKAYFVVANSLAENNKAATSDFNERVVECRIACRILAKRLNFNNWKEFTRFAALQIALGCELEELEQLVQQEITKDLYTRMDILEELGITEEELKREFLTSNTKEMQYFKLHQRALHVIQESIRVWKFRTTCDGDDANIESLSELMKQSHNSLRSLYECSHPSLDKLVEISEHLGIGARLTGAGWGGCIVALCSSAEACDKYIKELKDKYYKHLPQAKGRNLDSVIFATCPQSGAEIFCKKEK